MNHIPRMIRMMDIIKVLNVHRYLNNTIVIWSILKTILNTLIIESKKTKRKANNIPIKKANIPTTYQRSLASNLTLGCAILSCAAISSNS